MKRKIAELILIAAVVGSIYTDDCVYSPWQRGDCNCKRQAIPITRTLLSGGDDCKDKTKLVETCDCATQDNESINPIQCGKSNKCPGGGNKCANTKDGFTTYTFKVSGKQRCFTVFHPLSRKNEVLPVVISTSSRRHGSNYDMKDTSSAKNKAAAKYGYARIAISSPDNRWKIPTMLNDEVPMRCSDSDTYHIPYVRTVLDFIESNPSRFDASKIYIEGFSTNGKMAAYLGFCFNKQIKGFWQGGGGLYTLNTPRWSPGGAGYFDEAFKYRPFYPCYTEDHPMRACLNDYTNDGVSNKWIVSEKQWFSASEYAFEMYQKEGHDARLIRFSPTRDKSIKGGHNGGPKNLEAWQAYCLGYRPPCSETCEAAVIECVESKDTSTAENRTVSFASCMENMPEGCLDSCSPTLNMMRASEEPTTLKLTTTSQPRISPANSVCSATDYTYN